MYTIKLPYCSDGLSDHLSYQKNFSSCVKASLNLRKKNPELKSTEISALIKENYSFPLLDASLKEYAVATAFRLKATGTLTFGGKKNWKLFNSGTLTKEDWELKKTTPLFFRGRKSTSEKGNRKFDLKIIEDNKIIFKPNKNNHFEFRLPNLSKSKLEELYQIQTLVESGKLATTIGFNHEYVYITIDEKDLVPENYTYDFIENRILSIDLNPNYIGVVVVDYSCTNSRRVIHEEIISIKDLNDKEEQAFKALRKLPKGTRKIKSQELKSHYSSKRNHEIFQISKRLVELAYHYKCENFAAEELSMNSKNHSKGRRYNRLLNNQWNREALYQNLQKRCNLKGIRFRSIAPQYSSFIGQLSNPKDYDMIAAAKEIGRRANLFIRRYIKKENIESGIVFPPLDLRSLADCWNGKLRMDEALKSWVELYRMIKNSKQSYRVFFDQKKTDLFFRLKSRRSLTSVYTLESQLTMF